MTVTLFILLLLLGLITGFYSGLIGTGGNVILIPALDLLFVYYGIDGNESVKFIIAHSLFITVFLGLAVSYRQYRIGNFHMREVLTIGIPGMISAYLVSEFIKTSNWYDKSYFELIFLILLILLAIRLLFFKRKENEKQKTSNNKNLYYIFLGTLTGGVTSLSGLGGGVTLIPFLTDIMKKSIKKASSISIGVIMLLAISVSSSYLIVKDNHQMPEKLPFQTGYISMYLVVPILIGIFIASSYGVRMAQKISPLKLRIIFGIVISTLCIKMTVSLLMR